MKKKKIAILRGGKKSHEESSRSGTNVLCALSKYLDEVEVSDVLIDKNENWFEKGVPSDMHRAFSNVDYFLDLTRDHNLIYHNLAKELNLKHLFNYDQLNLSNRVNLKRIFEQIALDKNIFGLPKYFVFRDLKIYKNELKNIFQKFHIPLVVKNNNFFSKDKSCLTYSFSEAEKKIRAMLESGDEAIIEEHIEGRYVSVSLLPEYRGERYYIPIPVETIFKNIKDRNILHPDLGEILIKEKFLIDHKHSKRPFLVQNDNLKNNVHNLVKIIHETLCLDSHVMVDLAITKNNKIIVLEIHLDPHFFSGSRFTETLENSGVNIGRFILDRIGQQEEFKLSY